LKKKFLSECWASSQAGDWGLHRFLFLRSSPWDHLHTDCWKKRNA